MSPLVLILLIGGSLASTTRLQKVYYDPDEAEVHFEEFVRTFDRHYADDDEKQMRLEIFREKLKEINRLNAEDQHATFGITMFADRTPEEISQYSCIGGNKIDDFRKDFKVQTWNTSSMDLPEAFDWRERNAVGPVKYQGRTCGSCWAFSAVGALEGQYAIKHGQIESFSEQQLVDCDKRSRGCHGGWMANGYQALYELGGAMTENDYPYVGVDEACRFDPNRVAARLTGYQIHSPRSEDELLQILYSVGPVALVMEATTLLHYNGGILFTRCPGDMNALHGVVLIGYGTENGVPYWILKNSWGEGWGEGGFFRVVRNYDYCTMMNFQLVTPQVA